MISTTSRAGVGGDPAYLAPARAVIVLRWRGYAIYFTLATFSGRAAASPRERPMVRIRLPPAPSQERTDARGLRTRSLGPGFRTTTIESKTNIFRACEPGRLTGVAVPVHVGRRMIVLQTSIYRADGKLAAMMIQTQMVLPRGSATPAGEGGSKAYVPTQPVFP